MQLTKKQVKQFQKVKKGFSLDVYRSDYDSKLNAFHGATEIKIVGVVFHEPNRLVPLSADVPDLSDFICHNVRKGDSLAVLVLRWVDSKPTHYIQPLTTKWVMNGGTYAGTTGCKVVGLLGFYGAMPIHDRIEA